MFGLSPMPPRGDLKAVITGKVENESGDGRESAFSIEPGLVCDGEFLSAEENRREPLPTILYVCGHGSGDDEWRELREQVGVSASRGLVRAQWLRCLIIDTVQLGEIQGLHHGTYREGMWWWNSRGYTSAGVEAWNCIRALDYLETRTEVDKTKFGVTGRCGGGAYSWWIAIALDDRIQSRRAGRGYYRSAGSRGGWNGGRALRLHVLREHVSLGLSDVAAFAAPNRC